MIDDKLPGVTSDEGSVSKVGKVRTVACDVGGKISLFFCEPKFHSAVIALVHAAW